MSAAIVAQVAFSKTCLSLLWLQVVCFFGQSACLTVAIITSPRLPDLPPGLNNPGLAQRQGGARLPSTVTIMSSEFCFQPRANFQIIDRGNECISQGRLQGGWPSPRLCLMGVFQAAMGPIHDLVDEILPAICPWAVWDAGRK